MTTITNLQFAKSVGLHHTMASRLRNGERKPGLATVIATMRAYNLTSEQVSDWLDAIDKGAPASGAWLRSNIFVPRPVERVA